MKNIVTLMIVLFIGSTLLMSKEYFNQKSSDSYDEQGRPNFHKDRIYVKFKPNANINVISQKSVVGSQQSKNVVKSFGMLSIDDILKNYTVEKIETAFRQRNELPKKVREKIQNTSTIPDLSRIYSVKFSEQTNTVKLIKELNQNPDIEYAEFVPCDYLAEVPNDSLYDKCQHLPQIFAEQAWEIFKGEQSDSTIMIGISDTGTDWNHPDLTGNLWQNLEEDANKNGKTIIWDDSLKKYILDPGDLDGIDGDGNGFVDDLIGWDFLEDFESDSQGNNPQDFNNHGTHVAGIAAGVTNNSIGISSISWNVKFVPTSHSSPNFHNILRGYEGIVYLAELGCDVINCSWGGGGYSRANAEVIEYANSIGTIVVVAAGNNIVTDNFYPSAFPLLVSVASVASNDKRAVYSNNGKHIDISAPGGQTSFDGGIMSCMRNGGYARNQGTSMASPVAASVFGLVKAKFPDWTNEQIKRQIIGTADNIDSLNPNYLNMLGSGRINAFRALTETNIVLPNILKLDLMNVDADDSTDNSNMNKALEPGENIRIGFILRNYSILTGSESTNLTITCEDPDIEIIQNTFNAKFTPDGYTQTPLVFEVKISETAKSKFVNFSLKAESDDAEVVLGDSLSFNLPINAGGILVWEGQTNVNGFSGKFISDFLKNQGVDNLYTNIFPISMVGYDAVLLSFGSIGSNMGSLACSDWMADDITDYLKSGGKLYLEGMDVLGFDQMLNKEFLSLFGIDSSADGSDKPHSIDTLLGMQGTICEGLIFRGANIGNFQSIDEIIPDENGKVALYEPNFGNAAIQNVGEYGQKTFAFVYPLAHIIDRVHPNSRYELIKRIMDFMEYPIQYTIPRYSYYPKTGHAPLTVQFNDASYSSRTISEWEWEFENDELPIITTKNTIKYEFTKPEDYVPKMIAKAEGNPYSVSNPLYVFDGESAAYFTGWTKGEIQDTNMNVQGAFTIEAWLKPSSFSSGGWVGIAGKGLTSLTMNNEGRLKLYVNHENRSETDILTSTESMTFNTWQHVAVSFDGDSTFKIYVNGMEADTAVSKGPGKGTITSNKNDDLKIAIGYEGRLDEVRYWNIERSITEIRSNMFKKLQGKQDSLLLYWQFNEGIGDTAKDFSPNKRTCKLNSDWRQGIHESQIVSQPQSGAFCEGKSYSINTEIISGGYPLTFQWTKNGKLISNAHESKYYIDEMSDNDVGNYQLIINNYDTGGREFSDTAFISIDKLPLITEQPQEIVQLHEGETLELTINVDTQDSLKYEWFKNDESLNYYDKDYIKENVTISDTGNYNCVITSNCGLVESGYSNVRILTDINENSKGELCFDVLPNPINGNSKIIINTMTAGEYRIVISDILGNNIYIKNGIIEEQGISSIKIFNEFDLTSTGLYFITLEIEGKKLTKPLIYSK